MVGFNVTITLNYLLGVEAEGRVQTTKHTAALRAETFRSSPGCNPGGSQSSITVLLSEALVIASGLSPPAFISILFAFTTM